MASNKELTDQANELAGELGLKIDMEGLNNKKLAELVSDLRAKKQDADNKTLADDAEDKADAAEAEKAKSDTKAKKPPFYVMPGKSITSKRGILATERNAADDNFTEIKVSDLAGGKDALSAFIESGYIGKS